MLAGQRASGQSVEVEKMPCFERNGGCSHDVGSIVTKGDGLECSSRTTTGEADGDIHHPLLCWSGCLHPGTMQFASRRQRGVRGRSAEQGVRGDDEASCRPRRRDGAQIGAGMARVKGNRANASPTFVCPPWLLFSL